MGEEVPAEIFFIYDLFKSYDPYPGCKIDNISNLEEILSKTDKSTKNIESLLFSTPPTKESFVPLIDLSGNKDSASEDSKRNTDTDLTNLNVILHRQENTLPNTANINPELASIPENTTEIISPIDIDKDEKGITQIRFNAMKIKYIAAQNQILENYIKYARILMDAEVPADPNKFPAPAIATTLLSEFMNTEYTHDIKNIGADTKNTDIKNFLNEITCSFQEINFLNTILKKYGKK